MVQFEYVRNFDLHGLKMRNLGRRRIPRADPWCSPGAVRLKASWAVGSGASRRLFRCSKFSHDFVPRPEGLALRLQANAHSAV